MNPNLIGTPSLVSTIFLASLPYLPATFCAVRAPPPTTPAAATALTISPPIPTETLDESCLVKGG